MNKVSSKPAEGEKGNFEEPPLSPDGRAIVLRVQLVLDQSRIERDPSKRFSKADVVRALLNAARGNDKLLSPTDPQLRDQTRIINGTRVDIASLRDVFGNICDHPETARTDVFHVFSSVKYSLGKNLE